MPRIFPFLAILASIDYTSLRPKWSRLSHFFYWSDSSGPGKGRVLRLSQANVSSMERSCLT